jgi:hypothetical protein
MRPLTTLCTLVLVQACATENVTEVIVASVSVLPASAAIVAGGAMTFEVVVFDERGAALEGAAVLWSSDAPDIVLVDEAGVARAQSDGVARVEASVRGVRGSATVTVLPAPSVELAETGGATSVSETGTTDSFTVVLGTGPEQDVVVTVTGLNPGEATVTPTRLTFTRTNWATPTTVVVTGVDDPFVDGDRTARVCVSVDDASGTAYAAVADRELEVTVLDDDIAGFRLIETGSGTWAWEGGAPDTIRIVLTAGPLADVVLRITSDDEGDAALGPSTPLSWNVPQAVSFTAVEDGRNDGVRQRTVRVFVDPVPSDPAFHGLSRTAKATTLDSWWR